MSLKSSEFIQNADGSIYHLNLLPEQLANKIITVGDPDRVKSITKHFDTIECSVNKREFHTTTGTYKGTRISVISTGIGTDNIDIVFNELDALVNIDFETKTIKEDLTSLEIYRIGTSGTIQADIPVDAFLVSESAIGLDSLIHFYKASEHLDTEFSDALMKHLDWPEQNGTPYKVSANEELFSKFAGDYHKGITLTNCGFYGPQGRVLRLAVQDPERNDKLASFKFAGKRLTNLEMETAGIYGLSKLLGHKAVSLNAIIANRATGDFSKDPNKVVEELIVSALDRIIA